MRIVLVQMPPNPRDTPPYDVAMCAAILRRAGHEVVVRDVNNEMYHRVFKQRPYWKFKVASHQEEPSFALFEERRELFVEEADRLLALRPDVIVFRTENAFYNAYMTARFLRDKRPSLPLVSTGALTPDKEIVEGWKTLPCFSRNGEYNMPFDYHIVGEDELVLPVVLQAIAAGPTRALPREFDVSGKVVDSRQGSILADLDALPFYDFTDFNFGSYGDPMMLRLNVSRGCPKHCAFCIDWIAVRRYRCMSGDRWFEEYECQLGRHPAIRHIRHYDRLLNGNVAALERFTDRMLARYDRPPVAWGGDCVVSPEMRPELIAKMARAGCNNLGIGFESGSERVRRSMDKGFFDNAQAEAFLKNCKDHGIGATVNIIVGFPSEVEADFQESLSFIERNRENIFEIRVTTPTLQVVRGSVLASSPDRYGLADAHEDRWVSERGDNTYEVRVDRFRRLCESLLERNVRLAVNRRLVKTAAHVRQLIDELEVPRASPPSVPTDRAARAWSRFEAARASPGDPQGRIRLAEPLLAEFDDADTRACEIRIDLGYWHLQAAAVEGARRHFEEAARRRASNDRVGFNARLGLARVGLAQTGDARAAIEAHEALLAECGSSPGFGSELHYEIARLFVRLGDGPTASRHFRRILDQWPDPQSPWFEKARAELAEMRP